MVMWIHKFKSHRLSKKHLPPSAVHIYDFHGFIKGGENKTKYQGEIITENQMRKSEIHTKLKGKMHADLVAKRSLKVDHTNHTTYYMVKASVTQVISHPHFFLCRWILIVSFATFLLPFELA